ncbi:MAG TPA: Npt1/Npt2 family nucleotide transporter [Holophagaceae bacterium]|nr:Npt1/Npt2 family nucleotide transporter [Holophagaceae bacterium]
MRALRRLVMLEPDEGPLLAWATAYFFLLLLSYYLLRPLREAMGIAQGADKLPWLMTGTMLAMLLVNPAYAAMVSRWPRRRFLPATCRFFALNMLLLAALFRLLPGHGGAALGYTFYIWVSVFNLFVVAGFWGLMADVFNEDQARRLFGFIAVGGTLGAMAGSQLTDWLSHRVPPAAYFLLAALALEGATRCMLTVAARGRLDRAGSGEPGPKPLEGLRLIAKSTYLQNLTIYMLLFTITTTLFYLKQGQIVAKAFPTQAARTSAFARIDLYTNLLTLLTQLFLTSRVISRFGVAVVLVILPALTLVSFGALWAWPTFATLATIMVVRRGLHYALSRPAREMLYIPLGPEEKYKSKAFIDTFIFRAGDFMGVWLPTLLAAVAVAAAPISLALSGAWIGCSLWLGRLRARLKPCEGPSAP